MTPKLHDRGIYVSREHLAREKIAALLTEAAVLVRGGTLEEDVSALLSMGLATIKFADLDADMRAASKLIEYLHERKKSAQPDT